MKRLEENKRIFVSGTLLRYKMYFSDFPVTQINNIWKDLMGATDMRYVVQTNEKVIQRCLLMTTDPGDLVLDPTCGSGTTAYVSEQWGRRWITIDTSRVPLALARQRLLTATFDYYELREPDKGPAGGFKYERRQNNKGEEVGGIVPHVTLKSIAQNEPPAEEILVDRPENVSGVVRVSGTFAAAREAYAKSYTHLFVIGFSAQANATKFIQNCAVSIGIPATYVNATMDILMADLLKTSRASQIFSVTGQPEIKIIKLEKGTEPLYQVELLGLDVFKPDTIENDHTSGRDGE